MIYLELFITFLKIGTFTFGGGYAMLPLIQSEVIAHGWLTNEEMIDFIAISESTPGPFAVNISTYVGSMTAGFCGALLATLGVVLPSFIIILIIAKFFMMFQQNRIVQGALYGLKPAVVGLIGAAVFSVLQTVFFQQGISLDLLSNSSFWLSVGLTAILVLLAFKKIHPIIIIIISGIVGILINIGK